jgi:large subunit ribosomal protein L31
MAKSVNTTFYTDATAKCTNCGSTYTFGMSVESLNLEVCGNCHPYYTGKETRVDTAGKIEKFQVRAAKAAEAIAKKTKTKVRKSSQTLADLTAEESGSADEMTIVTPAFVPETEEKAE